jgi:small GTP-binding protein
MQQVQVLKVVVGGEGTVGKTSLIRRYCQGKFEASRVATIGVDFQTQLVKLPEKTVKLSIWDMAGQDRFRVIRGGFYRGSRASALVYDVSQAETFAQLGKWRDEILQVVAAEPFVVVGNKTDLARVLSADEARAFASSIGAEYLETSALTGEGVATLFDTLARLAVGS